MDIKEFLRPTKSKILVFFLIIGIIFLSTVLSPKCFGECKFPPLKQFILDSASMTSNILSPGINAMAKGNEFFIYYKRYGTLLYSLAGDVLVFIFHIGFDIIYWYLLACLSIFVYNKAKSRRNLGKDRETLTPSYYP